MINSKKNPIIYGTLLLSFSGLLCRGIGFIYHLFIARKFGEEAMGIFQLTSPVLILAYSLTCAGFQTGLSKFVASCMGQNQKQKAHVFFYWGCFIALFFSLIYSFLIYHFSEPIASIILGEKKCAPLLRIFAFSFPFSSMHSCINGYFYGTKNTKLPAITQIAEQLVRVGSVIFLYTLFTSSDQTPSIAITCFGIVLGEMASCIFSFSYYNFACRPYSLSSLHTSNIGESSFFSIPGQLLAFSFPLTLNRVIVNLLQSYETILLPAALKKYGYSSHVTLSIYGVLTGMAMSFVLFPSTFVNSFSVLLLPKVSETQSKGDNSNLKLTIRKAILFCLILGFFCTLFFFFGGNLCGTLFFNSTLAGHFIKTLSFLCPFLYLHNTLNSVLNGLKKTNETLFINLFSLLIRLLTILFIVPYKGMYAYLYGFLLSEIISSLLCFYFLRKFIIIKKEYT